MRFQPLHFGWAALPPQPKGIIVFIGGAFFGSFPTIFYRAFLQSLYDQDFGIVALPFRFTFHHWDIALSLTIYAKELRDELRSLREAAAGQGVEVPEIPYLWIGHSLGCKYIALLELLSEGEDMCKLDAIMNALQQVAPRQKRDLQAKLDLIDATQVSLRNQPQLLVDPVIASLDAAIPFKPLEALFAPFLKISPSRDLTFKLIDKTELFSLTWIASLVSDTSRETILRLISLAQSRRLPAAKPVDVVLANRKPLLGPHLAILGFTATDPGITAAISAQLDIIYPIALHYQRTAPSLLCQASNQSDLDRI